MRLLCHLAFPFFFRRSPLFSRRKQSGQKGKNNNNNGAGKTKATIALVYHCSRYTRAPTAYTQFPYTFSPFRAPFFGPFLVRFVLLCFVLFCLSYQLPPHVYLRLWWFLLAWWLPCKCAASFRKDRIRLRRSYLSPTKRDVQLKSQLPIELLNFRPLLSPPPGVEL